MENTIRFKQGMTALEVVEKIVATNLEIPHLSFDVLKPTYNVKETSKTLSPSLARLLYHNASSETIRLTRIEITAEYLQEIISLLKRNSVLAVISKVRVGKKNFHIPMMDFQDEALINNLPKIERFLRVIGQQGVILFSGRGYHFYGFRLMEERVWRNFMGDCGLSGLADSRYIFHRLKDDCGTLRLSAYPLRPKTPTVVSVLLERSAIRN